MATNRFSAPTLEIVTFIYVFDYLQIFAHQGEIEGETLSEVV